MTQVIATLAALAALVFALPVRVAEARPLVEEERELAGFDEIRFDGSGTLEVAIGEDFRVVIESTEKALLSIGTRVRGDELHIWREFGALLAPLHVEIALPSLKALELNGSVEAQIVGRIRTEDFELRSAGSASTKLESLDVEELTVNLAGSGDLVAAGTAKRLDLETNGSADLRLARLEAEVAKIRIAGSGRADLHVTSSLDATIYGSGRIHLSGSPDHMSVATIGSGRIIQKRE